MGSSGDILVDLVRIAKLVKEGLTKSQIFVKLGEEQDMPERTFQRRWRKFIATDNKNVKKEVVEAKVLIRKRGEGRVSEAHSQYRDTKDMKCLYAANKFEKDNIDNLAKLGVLDKVSEKIDISIDGAFALALREIKEERKSDVKGRGKTGSK